MIAQDFAKAVGGTLAHVTAARNLPAIERDGLRSAEALARRAELSADDIILRKVRQRVGEATLNHQLPILHGITAAARVLDGHTPASWAAQLDRRIFFWPISKLAKFRDSIQRDFDTDVIHIDALAFAETFFDHIDLCALNSGNFTQGGAHAVRGDWIYSPLTAGLPAFRNLRRDRGLVKTTDTIKEVSLRCPVPAETLAALRVH